MPFTKLDAFTKKVSDLPDVPSTTMTAAQVKAQFDAAPDEVRTYFNNLVDALKSPTDSDSGADNIGVTPISTSPSTVQGVLEWLSTQINNSALGQIPDGSLTKTKMDLSVQTSLNKADGAETPTGSQTKVDNLGILYWMG